MYQDDSQASHGVDFGICRLAADVDGIDVGDGVGAARCSGGRIRRVSDVDQFFAPATGGWASAPGTNTRTVDPVGELEPQKDAALGLPHLFDRGAELALDGLDHRVELVVQCLR